jgi:hypothetical protein
VAIWVSRTVVGGPAAVGLVVAAAGALVVPGRAVVPRRVAAVEPGAAAAVVVVVAPVDVVVSAAGVLAPLPARWSKLASSSPPHAAASRPRTTRRIDARRMLPGYERAPPIRTRP